MGWLESIIGWFVDIGQWFYRAYIETSTWGWPFNLLSHIFNNLKTAFYWLAYHLTNCRLWLEIELDKIAKIWTSDGILGLIKWWFPWIYDIGDWFWERWQWLLTAVGNWWETIKPTVLGWIDAAWQWLLELIDDVKSGLADLGGKFQWFFDNLLTFDEIIQWWKNWLANIMGAMVQWGFARLVDVGALIAAGFLERENFWAGWQEIRDSVMEFFTDPLEFLLDLFTDWFLGPEE